MATFVDLYGELLHRELGTDDVTVLFTTARRKAAINEAQREFVRLTECLTREFDVPLADNDQELDLLTLITNGDFLWPAKQGVEIEKIAVGGAKTFFAGDDFPRRDIVWLNRYEPGWRNATKGNPMMYYVREDGGRYFVGLYPPVKIAAGETWNLTVPYVANPADMVADGNEPFTVLGSPKKHLVVWHQALVHFAAARLEALRKNRLAIDDQMKMFGGYVADYLQRQRPKGGQFVSYARNYRSEMRRSQRPLDPRRY